MKIRSDVADMLRDGHTHIHIMRTLHVAYPTVKAAREHLGLPDPKTGGRPAETPQAALDARTEPIDGGHRRWTGYRGSTGGPMLACGGVNMSGYRLAFRIRHGREPVGRVTSGCDYEGCVAPDHVEDRPMREQLRTTYAAIFGEAAR